MQDQMTVPGLAAGKHEAGSGQLCAMEMVSWMAKEEHSDHPQCVCPVIGAFMRSWNDGLPDADRDRILVPLLPLTMNTRGDAELEERRAWAVTDWLVRAFTPAWMDLSPSLREQADNLRGLPELNAATWQTVRPVLAAASAAAWDAAWAAARAAARAAASAAARAAARAAAWDAAAPTVATLQQSASELVRRLCEMGQEEQPGASVEQRDGELVAVRSKAGVEP